MPVVDEVLQLLVNGATTSQLTQAGGGHPAVLAAALELQRTLDDAVKRESRLSALVALSRDVASESVPDGLLTTIVGRTRELLGADVAYLSLYDPDRRDTYIHTSSGVRSSLMFGLRVPFGAGLGGLVASSRTSRWTSRYNRELHLVTTDDIEAAVEAEEIVTISGTPLVVDGELIGVLFAGYRSECRFSSGDLELLDALAALAAVSLVQIRNHARTKGALAELTETASAHAHFNQVLLGGGGIAEITAGLADLLGLPVWIFDTDGICVAPERGARADGDRMDIVHAAAGGSGQLVRYEDLWTVAILADGTCLGALAVAGQSQEAGELSTARTQILQRAASVAAFVLQLNERMGLADARSRELALLQLLNTDGPISRAVHRRLQRLHTDPAQRHVLAVCRMNGEQAAVVVDRVRRIEGASLFAAVVDDEAVVLVRDGSGEPVEQLVEIVRAATPTAVTVGLSASVNLISGLHVAYAEARRAADCLLALGRVGDVATLGDLGVGGLLVGESPNLPDYVRQVLGPLLDYDHAHGSSLVQTVQKFLESGRHRSRTARALHVHPNTVSLRLERVAALLGADWSAPAREFELNLALRLYSLLPPY